MNRYFVVAHSSQFHPMAVSFCMTYLSIFCIFWWKGMCLYSVHPYVISPFEQLGATRREVFVYRFRRLFLQKGHRFDGVL